MSLTKSDKAEIKKMIREALMEPQDTAVELSAWEPKVLKKSEMLDIEIADKNYWEYDDNGDKKELFTWEEAMEIEGKLSDGWRLPTRSEWVVLAEEFGVDECGELDKDIFMQSLSMGFTGYRTAATVSYPTAGGWWWSRSAYSATRAYNLGFYSGSGSFYPQDHHLRWCGFAVRLVRDMEDKE